MPDWRSEFLLPSAHPPPRALDWHQGSDCISSVVTALRHKHHTKYTWLWFLTCAPGRDLFNHCRGIVVQVNHTTKYDIWNHLVRVLVTAATLHPRFEEL